MVPQLPAPLRASRGLRRAKCRSPSSAWEYSFSSVTEGGYITGTQQNYFLLPSPPHRQSWDGVFSRSHMHLYFHLGSLGTFQGPGKLFALSHDLQSESKEVEDARKLVNTDFDRPTNQIVGSVPSSPTLPPSVLRGLLSRDQGRQPSLHYTAPILPAP